MNSGKPEPLSPLFSRPVFPLPVVPLSDAPLPDPQSDPLSDALPLALLSRFIRGLTHRLRTPLSVISNDLSYFKTLLPAEECERSQLRCREVAAALKDISACSSQAPKFEEISIDRLLSESARSQQITVTWECERDLAVRADSAMLAAALRWFFEGWQALGRAGFVFPQAPSCCVMRRPELQTLSVSLRGECRLEPCCLEPRRLESGGREYHSLAAFYDECPDLDQYTSVLVDAILWAHAGRVHARVGPLLELSVLLPVPK